MRKRFFRGVAATIVLIFAQAAAADPPSDPSTWESAVVTTGKVMFVSGDLKINDFSAALDNGLVGVFVPSIATRPVGVYRFGAGTGGYSFLAVYGSTGGLVNGALPNEPLSFWFQDNTSGLATLALTPNGTVTYQGAEPSYTYPSAVPLRVYYPPTITAFDNSGVVGARVAIAGANFCAVSANDNVTFTGGVRATVDNVVDGMNLVVTVPAGAQSGPIRITTPGGTFLTSGSFTVPPRITGFSPGSGGMDTTVTIGGYNFGSTPTVAFAGAPASVVSASDNEVVATVPAEAITGTITVTTSAGTATSTDTFSVPPSVVGFNPTSGRVGDNVTITGYNFDDSSASATSVSFNGVPADIVSGTLTRTSLVAAVPAGADNGAITVTTAGGQATSTWSFTVVVLPPNHFPDPVPSGFVTTVGGTIGKNGVPASMGDEVAAYSVHRKPGSTTKFEKTLIGRAMLTTAGGVLSGMEVYGDDTATTGAVEGAGQGEEICFVLW
ncbi:MAG: IPT/TIG domain-containing protein, partial [Ignavibacteriaceae bacterium]|nr:IPT/TIG domain-containing protein [Ignavibacteriaceae bacterium]